MYIMYYNILSEALSFSVSLSVSLSVVSPLSLSFCISNMYYNTYI